MVDSLSEFRVPQTPAYMRTERFKSYVESVLTVLLSPSSVQALPIEPTDGWTNRSDLAGFLLDKNIPVSMHYTIMRMNGFTSMTDFNETVSVLYLPNENVFSELMTIYTGSLR